jgi:RNA-directed DNA polymerase
MADRAGQALAKRALEPAGEAQFAPNRAGCRPGRSGHEALEAMHASLNHQDTYVWDADMEQCCDRLCHQALGTQPHPFPALRRTMTAWLQAGGREGEDLLPTETGAPQGGGRSPLVMHVARHGLETAMTSAYPMAQDGHRWQPRVIRCADDLVVFHRDSPAIGQAQDMASNS